jgi:hypothetical protein
MHEVPLAQRVLLAIEDHDALSVQDEEVLLHGLRVVAAVGLTRLHDLDIHAGVGPRRLVGLERDDRGPARVSTRRRRGDIGDEWLVGRQRLTAFFSCAPAAKRGDFVAAM